MEINRKNENDDLDTKNDLFIIPIEYEDKLDKSQEEDDNHIHFAQTEVNMYKNGSKIWCLDLPKNFSLATEAGKSIMHYQTLKNPQGERYMPLFTSYSVMISIFGSKLREL